jgi:hypothetical protein
MERLWACSTVCVVPPVIAFCFIVAKQIIGLRDGWGKAPLMVLLTRDGSLGVLGLLGEYCSTGLDVKFLSESVNDRGMASKSFHIKHDWWISCAYQPSVSPFQSRIFTYLTRFPQMVHVCYTVYR